MGVDQVSRHDHSSDSEGGSEINPESVSAERASNDKLADKDDEITVNVPGDFDTLQEAVDNVLHVFPAGSGVKAIVNIESGHSIQQGPKYSDPAGQEGDDNVSLWVEGVDASHIWIRSEDDTVDVASDHDGSVIRGIRSRLPVLDCLIDMDNSGDGLPTSGYAAELGSVGYVMPDAGCLNSGGDGLRARQSSILYAGFGVEFTGADSHGCNVNHGSLAYIREGDFSDADEGIRSRGPVLIDAEEVTIDNTSSHAINIMEGAVASFARSTIDTPDGHGIRCYGSHAHADYIDITDAKYDGVQATRGSFVSCNDATVTGSDLDDVLVAKMGMVSLTDTETTSSSSSDEPHEDDLSQSINSVEGDGIIFAQDFETS